MRVRLTLPAGAPGTKRLVQEYGNRLICVRYRYGKGDLWLSSAARNMD